MKLRTYSKKDIGPGTRVLLRVDANVPVKNGRVVEGALGRLPRSILEIQALRKLGAAVVLVTHLGDPSGCVVPSLSTRPIARAYEKLLKTKIHFCSSVVGGEAEAMSRALKPGEIMMIENVRFEPGEEKNSLAFAKQLARLADAYVNNAFGVCHRKHASIHALAQILPSFAGQLLQEETRELSRPLTKPFVLAMAGMKLETKVPLLEALAPRASGILIGGGLSVALLAEKMGKTFSLAEGLIEEKERAYAKQILVKYGKKLLLPLDVVVRKGTKTTVQGAQDFDGTQTMIDIGPKAARQYAQLVAKAKTVVWNGPFGKIEDKAGREGTVLFAKALAKSRARSVVGGGDTIAFLESAKIGKGFSFLSTGGGAMLAFLSGASMPGLDVLRK